MSKIKWIILVILCFMIFVFGFVAYRMHNQFMSYDLSELGQGYYWSHYWIERMDKRDNWQSSSIVINPEVIECTYDSRFIHVKQNPNISYFNDYIFPTYTNQSQRDSVYSCFYKEYSMGLCYWIVDKERRIRYGPYQRDDYYRMCDSLSIKNKLE